MAQVAVLDLSLDRVVSDPKFASDVGYGEAFGDHWIKFSIGIPVIFEMRRAALAPKVLLPLR